MRRESDSEQVQRGKDEKDFEKRVKECLKLSGGKRMGAAMRLGRMRNGDERSANRLGVWTDADCGGGQSRVVVMPWRRRSCDRGEKRAPFGVPPYCVLSASACGLPIRPS
ncbi:hypothetical protein Syun_006788 [Stephania yunnanensis]|uniref:Uncharacterized protein n=1 Tax=Stephania yunnanensis TaxID=152371 RepID=A0AAP0PXW0_9MAGN